MKAKREHRVPLCGRAVILDEARTLGGTAGRSRRRRCGKMLKYLDIADGAAEKTDHPREVIEAALAHVVPNKVEAA